MYHDKSSPIRIFLNVFPYGIFLNANICVFNSKPDSKYSLEQVNLTIHICLSSTATEGHIRAIPIRGFKTRLSIDPYCNYFYFNFRLFLRRIGPFTSHLHFCFSLATLDWLKPEVLSPPPPYLAVRIPYWWPGQQWHKILVFQTSSSSFHLHFNCLFDWQKNRHNTCRLNCDTASNPFPISLWHVTSAWSLGWILIFSLNSNKFATVWMWAFQKLIEMHTE